jgi:hypothetical protein
MLGRWLSICAPHKTAAIIITITGTSSHSIKDKPMFASYTYWLVIYCTTFPTFLPTPHIQKGINPTPKNLTSINAPQGSQNP